MALQYRQRLLMDWGWKFHKGDIIPEPDLSKRAIYLGSKAEVGRGAARPNYDDRQWETVKLPHDWVVAEDFDPSLSSTHQCKPRGVAWYRRAFRLDPSQRNKRVILLFDGVATHAQVWVNAHLVARNFNGYTSFYADITDIVSYGDATNLVAVRVDATDYEGWWYEGAGIYRHVWLVITDSVCVDTWGTYINPHLTDDTTWQVPIETMLYNVLPDPVEASLVSTIEAPDGLTLARAKSTVELAPKKSVPTRQQVIITDPQLWSLERPVLYRLRSRVFVDGQPVDDYETPFGFRTLSFDAQEGFLLNGLPVKIKGTANHQDHAGLGVALPDRVHAYRIRRLKAMGSNAYRTAHNPPAPELLDACDQLGMLVMDETRWFSSSDEGLSELESMVRRDRNHPSVIMWSIFNEEPVEGTVTGRRIAETMRARVRALDDSRPVTGAMHSGFLEHGAVEVLDIIGINYNIPYYDRVHEMHPEKALIAPEAAAAGTSRGIYVKDQAGHIPAYDRTHASFGARVREAWKQVDQRSYVLGLFYWTGIEYRGEAEWPRVHSQSGMLDTCGFAKDNAYLCLAMWSDDPPMVHILPHWNWPGRDGEIIDVFCYSNCDTVELYLDGQSLGEKACDPYEQCQWQVPYKPGVMQALGKRDGKAVAQDFVETTGDPMALQLVSSDPLLRADGEDVILVEVTALDADGTLVPTADQLVRFSVNEKATIIGVGNGDALSHEPDKACQRHLFSGKCQVIIQAGLEPGEVVLTAEADGLLPADLHIPAAAVKPRPHVPVVDYVWRLERWWMTSVSPEPITLEELAILRDNNTFLAVEVGEGPQAAFAGHPGYAALLHVGELPSYDRDSETLVLVFEGIQGSAEAYVAEFRDEEPDLSQIVHAAKEEQAIGPLTVDLSGLSEGARQIVVVVVVRSTGPMGGLVEPVHWEFEPLRDASI